MGVVTVHRRVEAPLEQVWRVVADVARHRLPGTTVRVGAGEPGVGWRFTGYTGFGPVGINDEMVVTRWSPPSGGDQAGYALVKTGRVLGGWAEVSLRRNGEGTEVTWREEIVPHPHAVGRLLEPVTDRAVRAMFGRAVDEMLARV